MNKEPDLHKPLLNYPVDVGRMARFGVLHQYVEEQIAGGETRVRIQALLPTCVAIRHAARTTSG